MGEKIIVGPINKGLRNDRTAFVIDNDSFPTLVNAYQWRGRVKRKRGTSFLGRPTRYFNSSITSYSSITTIALAAVTGAANLLTGFSLQTNGNIVPGSVTITVGVNTYTDPAMDGTLSPSGSINYATGAIAIVAEAGNSASAIFRYYPNLPIMGLEDLILTTNQFPGTLAFDTVYSYNILPTFPYNIYDVSFYKNPPASLTLYPGYAPKAPPVNDITPTTWNGQDYQQFWTVNYEGALWATNGITIPFTPTNIGMQFAPSSTITYVSNTLTTITLTITNSPLVIGDFVYFNEWTGANAQNLNYQTGYVTAAAPNTPPLAIKTVTITFPNAQLAVGPYIPGIVQYLTTRVDVTKDGIRWYDGDPTTGAVVPPVLTGNKGWVNFAPPLSNLPFSIADTPDAIYYLVGARMIVPFKDRLLFIGPVIQTSAANSQIYLQDTVIYSQNGTPYYTSSFTGDPLSALTQFFPILTPNFNSTSPALHTATATAYFEDSTGYGGFRTAGVDQPINTVSANEDVLIMGFSFLQTRFVYSGNDIQPFDFYSINSELGSTSTFSAINLDQGVMSKGSRAFVITGQTQAQRFDLEIPDQVFQLSLLANGTERVTAIRDFIKEWVYFTYPVNQDDPSIYKFNSQTLQYNYRDQSWAIFNESYTHYGLFRKQTGLTWATLPADLTWSTWNDPWNSGSSTLLQPMVIAGNQQGFIVFRDVETQESNSLYIQDFAGSVVTSPNHTLNEGDYIIISGALGTIDAEVNGKIFSVDPPITANTFTLNPTIGTGTYLGGAVIKRMYTPFVQTKQFPAAWAMERKTRIGVQQYLLSKTNNGQITLLIFLSQDDNTPYNDGPFLPEVNVENDSLIYSTVLYTCPESINLGLTPANVNLQMPTAGTQGQIWHRINTSLIGDTVQLGFTMSDAQMREINLTNQFTEIELHGFIINTNPSQMLS